MKNYRIELQLFFIALIIRLAALIIIPDLNFPDANTYRMAGAALFSGHDFSDKVMPLYPIIAYLTGSSWILKIFDCILSALTVILIYKISFQLFERRVAAILAGASAAIYPYFIFYSISGLTETSFVFLLCLAFYLFYRKLNFLACLVSAISLLIRPANDLLNPLLILTFIVFVHHGSWKTALKWLLVYAVIYCVILTPWWAYNYHRYHTFVRTNLGSGIVVYAGNNPMNHSGGGIGDIDVNGNIFETIKNPVKRNQAMIKAGIHYALSHPWHIVKLDGIKFLRFWRLYPYAPEYKTTSTIIISLLSYGVMLALCLIYLFRHFKHDWKKISPMLLLTLSLMIGCMLTIASIRYRFPIEPFIIILGCKTLEEFVQWLGQKPIPLTQNK